MSPLHVVIYDSNSIPVNVTGLFNRKRLLRYRTGLPGGYLDCTFDLPGLTRLPHWLRESQTLDVWNGNQRVWSGRVDDILRLSEAVQPRDPISGRFRKGTPYEGMQIRGLGWWSEPGQRTYNGTFTGTVYADTIIKAILTNSCPHVSGDQSLIQSPNVDLGTQTYANEYVADIIRDVLALGDDQATPREWYIALWDRVRFQRGGTLAATAFYPAASADDACDRTDGTYYESQDRVIHGPDGIETWTGGVRFQNVTVVQGSTVTAATLKIYAYDTTSDGGSFSIYADDADNSAIFSTGSRPSGRTKTTAVVTWTPGSWTAGTQYTSVDISAVVQEIIDRAGWTSGNALSLIMTYAGGSTYRRYRSYDYSPTGTYKAVLTITTQEVLGSWPRAEAWPRAVDTWEYEVVVNRDAAVQTARTTDRMANAVIASYGAGPSWTAWATDSDSQSDYHRRDYVLAAGSGMSQAVAEAARDMWLSRHKDIQRRTGAIAVRGRIRKRFGGWTPACQVRAGERVKVIDVDYGDSEVYVIGQTEYDEEGDTVQITPEDAPDTVATLLARQMTE